MKSSRGCAAAAILTAFLVAGPALAQQMSTTPTRKTDLRKVADDSLVVQPFNLSVQKIERMDVVLPTGEQVGDVAAVLADTEGKVAAFTVNTAGFLGIGGKEYVVPLSNLQLQRDRFVTSLTQAEIEKLPVYHEMDK